VRHVLGQRQPLGIAVDRAGRGKDQVPDPFLEHHPDEVQRPGHVDVVEIRRVAFALAHLDPPGKVHDRVRPVLPYRRPHRLGAAYVAPDQGAPAHGMFVSR
jgi:hypothetical protein